MDIQDTGGNEKEIAVLAGGCFWCLEAVFNGFNGVEEVVSGYAGGVKENPTYEEVSSGATGHAEAVQITFDPLKISFRQLLEIFFTVHDPTTLNRQDADVGTQYRSAIFYVDEQQKFIAQRVMRELNITNVWNAPIVTELQPFGVFYPAEDYHQHYYEKNPEDGYCTTVINPKVTRIRQLYASKLKNRAS